MRSLFIAGALALGISSAASAAIVTTTYEGTLLAGSADYAGLLGTPEADLAGLAFLAVLTFDTSVGRNTGVDGSGPFEEAVTDGGTSPLLSGTITLGGTAFALPVGGDFIVTRPTVRHLSGNSSAGTSYTFNVVTTDAPGSLDTAFTTTSFSFVDAFYSVPGDTSDGYPDIEAFFDVDRLTVTVATTAVPEPATWALMILGFGAAGATLRRRRAAALS